MLIAGLRGTRASDHLGLLRGLMAVAVLVYHVRYRFFVDWQDVAAPTRLAQAWYAMTAYGHDAVMVFFVVSGFLVGSTVIRDGRAGSWTWTKYLRARGTRLYVVLLPGLVLGACWDLLGLHFFGQHPIYTGAPAAYQHDYFNVAARLKLSTLIGNMTFLQSMYTSTFGSNDALWSLSYEFWYYVTFPLLALPLVARGNAAVRIAVFAAGAATLAALASQMVLLFPIWLLGAGIGLMPINRVIARRPRFWALAATLAAAAVVTATHAGAVHRLLGYKVWRTDYVIGIASALLVYTLLHDRRPSLHGMYSRTAATLADSSYTLYLAHLPLLVFVRGGLGGDAWLPEWPTIALAVGIAAVVFVYALAVAAAFEARTDIVRARVDRWLTRPAPASVQSV